MKTVTVCILLNQSFSKGIASGIQALALDHVKQKAAFVTNDKTNVVKMLHMFAIATTGNLTPYA